jgi:hypothetical protein
MMLGANDDETLILSSWHEWEIRGAERQVVLCIETVLELDPNEQGFDRERLDALLHQASQLMKASPSPIDLIRIVKAMD